MPLFPAINVTIVLPENAHLHVHHHDGGGLTLAGILAGVASLLHPIGEKVTQITETLSSQDATLANVQTDLAKLASDVAVLVAAGDQPRVFTPDEKVIADSVTARLAALQGALGELKVAVGDRDNSDATPPPVEPAVDENGNPVVA